MSCVTISFLFDSYRISGGDWVPGFGRSPVRGVDQGCLLFNIFLVKTMYGGLGSEWNERTKSSLLSWKDKIFILFRGPISSEALPSPPCFLFWETLYFIGVLILCSGYHLKFGVLRVFPGQVSFTVIIECSKIMF